MNDTLKVPDIGNPSVLDSGTAFQPHSDPIELPPSVTGERRIESTLADRKRRLRKRSSGMLKGLSQTSYKKHEIKDDAARQGRSARSEQYGSINSIDCGGSVESR